MPADAGHPTGPRYLDPDIEGRIKLATSKRYRKALAEFLTFLSNHHYTPAEASEFDDLLVEWKNSDRGVKKSTLEAAVASVEFALPQYRGKLPWVRAVLHSSNAFVHAQVHAAKVQLHICIVV